MNRDDIIRYSDVVSAEKVNLQKGMNFGIRKTYSILLMSVREGAPYADAIEKRDGTVVYEGHDIPNTHGGPDPKTVDQPLLTPSGLWTENGKFFRAAVDYKSGARKEPEIVKIYEKIHRGIWCYKGFFELINARIVPVASRKVFKFYLKPIEKKPLGRVIELPTNRIIPTEVKLEVWRRDKGRCVQCGSTQNLHYDHIIPVAKGGSSLVAQNVQILCAKHNLEKSDRIMSVLPLVIGL